MSYLVDYYEKIKSGEIVVGNELLTMLERLIKDMENPRYIYDTKPGHIRIDFIETFCKHTKSPFNGEPFILELWEKAVLEAAYGFKMASTGLRRFNEVLLLIARKNGKTTFLNPLTQNEHHIKILKSYFNEYEHLFKSLVIFTKANVTLKVSFDNVIKVSDIEKYFSSLETILNSSEIIEIFNKLNEKLLKIEIKK